MTSSYYESTDHIFYSENSDEVCIRPKAGQTLKIQGTMAGIGGPIGSVQYNKNGELYGESTFMYDDVDNRMTVSNTRTNFIDSSVSKDSLGFNEITRPTFYIPQTINTQFSAYLKSMGTDVSMAKNADYVALASPWYIFNDSKGGVSMWNKSGASFIEHTSILALGFFTLDASTDFTAINEDGTLCAISALAPSYKLSIKKRTGSSWATNGELLSCLATKLSGDYCLTYSEVNVFKIYFYNGTSWGLQSTLLTGIGSWADHPMAFPNNSTAVFYYNGIIRVYTRSGTSWTLLQNLTLANATSIDAWGTVIAACTPNTLNIYESNALVSSLSVPNIVYCTTNENYVFASTNTNLIYIASKILGVWSLSFNNTPYTGAKKLSCNTNYLTVGAPTIGTSGSAIIYTIEAYVDSQLSLNELDLSDQENLILFSRYGKVKSLSNLEVQGTLVNTGSITTGGNIASSGTISFASGNITTPALSFNSGNGGIYNSGANDIAFKCGASNTVGTFNTNGLVISTSKKIFNASGDIGSPSYTFDGATNTGISRPFGDSTMAFSANGEAVFYTTPILLIAKKPFRVQNGTVGIPTLSFENKGTTGFYSDNAGTDLEIAVNGGKVGHFDATGLVLTDNNRRILTGQGSPSAPGYSFFGKTNTGFWSFGSGGGTEIDVTVQGTTTAAFRPALTFFNTVMAFQVSGKSRFTVQTAGGADGSTSVFCYTGEPYLTLYYWEGAIKGSVSTNGSTVFFNTTSDSTLKKNIESGCNGLSFIRRMRPCKYDWKDDKRENPEKSYGFLAHEMKEILPEIVTGGHQILDGDGNLKDMPQMIDYTKIVPILTCAIKALDFKNTNLENENTLLKARVKELEDKFKLFEARLTALEPISEEFSI